jgi:biotin transport system substrate-specific component
MEKALLLENKAVTIIAEVIFGSLLITAGSLIIIPIQPIPITFQTVAILILALTQRPLVCFLSIIAYLAEGTFGLPVFGGFANPLWFTKTMAGYLIGFPIAGYLIATLIRKNTSPFLQLMALFLGQFTIHLFGIAILAHFIGFSAAFKSGFLLFIPIDLVKALFALSLYTLWRKSPLSFHS